MPKSSTQISRSGRWCFSIAFSSCRRRRSRQDTPPAGSKLILSCRQDHPIEASANFCLWSTAEGSSHYLNCSCCGHFVNLLPKCTSRFPFWGKHLRCTSGLNLAAHLGQVLALLELSVRNNTHHVSHLKVFSIVFLGVYKLLKFSKFPPPVVLSARPWWLKTSFGGKKYFAPTLTVLFWLSWNHSAILWYWSLP